MSNSDRYRALENISRGRLESAQQDQTKRIMFSSEKLKDNPEGVSVVGFNKCYLLV